MYIYIYIYIHIYIYIYIYIPNCLSVVLVICIAPVPLWYRDDKNASDFLAAHTVGLVTPATWHSESTFGIMFPNKKDQPIVSCLESHMLLKKSHGWICLVYVGMLWIALMVLSHWDFLMETCLQFGLDIIVEDSFALVSLRAKVARRRYQMLDNRQKQGRICYLPSSNHTWQLNIPYKWRF